MTTAEPAGFLLDTHAFLWLAAGDHRVPEPLRARLARPEHALWLSAASVWEMAIKKSLGKLSLELPLSQLLTAQCSAMRVGILDIGARHALAVEDLELHHRDPFDRLLVAQALVEGLDLVSRDEAFDRYPLSRVW